MTITTTRPSSPSRDLQAPQPSSPVLASSSSNDAALLGLGLSQAVEEQLNLAQNNHINAVPSSSSAPHNDMAIQHLPKEKDIRPRLEIVLDNDTVVLRGTGSDVEPARLSGHVALFLSESSSVKEITLQFRGKARIPAHNHDALTISSSTMTYVVCNHEWSFLKGERKHSHTLKAGHHIFPFQLQIGGSLPSSLFDQLPAGGTASVIYKFRAHAVRPGLSHNLHCALPVTVLRSFAPEALEYQQTLEIENTWPEKVMYSIMVPHKAWAAGDSALTILKLAPLAKGVHVTRVTTQIQETVKLYKGGSSIWGAEHTKVVARASHKIVEGRAVPVDIVGSPASGTSPAYPSASRSAGPGSASPTAGGYLQQAGSSSAGAGSSSGYYGPGSASAPLAPSSSSRQPDSNPHQPFEEEPSEDVITALYVPIPIGVTPSHNLEPVMISHRIRWSILISNIDGHTSELRCSLPLHVLDPRLLQEARDQTSMTRRLLLGAMTGSGAEEGEHGGDEDEESRDLPSYNSHIRDRIANQYVTERDIVRVGNPWSPHPRILPGGYFSTGHNTPGWMSPTHDAVVSENNHLPQDPLPSGASPLDWVNRRLLATRGQTVPIHTGSHGSNRDHTPEDYHSSPSEGHSRESNSRAHSRGHSRRSSRRGSPERRGATLPGLSQSFNSNNSHSTSNFHSAAHFPPPRPQDGSSIHVHGDAEDDSHRVGGLFAPQMRQVSSFASALSRSHPSSYTNLAALSSGGGTGSGTSASSVSASAAASSAALAAPRQHLRRSDTYAYGDRTGDSGGASSSRGSAQDNHNSSCSHNHNHGQSHENFTRTHSGEVLQRVQQGLTQVPDYGTAARGFMGGVTPLDLMQGLPSYDDAQRHVVRERPVVQGT
ncbi:hypothetical protein BDV98DRAFT_322873 [Pterulicium gracile]|uniref:Arrestin C-terminal-like domain-containing protein n=1 Tax=Pterulicium gracile TaxID=1884261 RepID=A0A5C3QRF5_9AGAR|nr:hypothetical protein BDV98DRAFT_322873 [Pterula gracilis]